MMALAQYIKSVSRPNLLIFTALWGFIFGILFASLISIPPLVCILVGVVAGAIYYADRNIFVLIFLLVFAVGAFRYDIKDFHELMPAGNAGVVVSEPEHREADTRFVVKTDTGEKVLVSTDLLSHIQYGDVVSLLGKAQIVKGDYADYLSKDDIFYTMNFAKVTKAEQPLVANVPMPDREQAMGVRLISFLLKVKSAFVEKMKSILPEPESSLLAGLVVSGKQALPASILEEFRRAGVVHIVVLSGYNVTIISEFFLILLAFLGRRRAALASAIGIILFTLMSGATATVVRAAIMVLLLLLGKVMNRQGSSPRILLFTAVLMLLQNPKILVFDPSFQLSFLAMLALIYGTPIMKDKLAKLALPAHRQASGDSRSMPTWLVDILATTLATQIFVLPYLLYNMGNFSLVFLLSNLLILLVIPYTMLIGFAGTLLAFISIILAWPLAFIAHLMLAWILGVAHFLGNLPFASIQIDNFPLWLTLILYVGLTFSVWRLRSSLPQSANSN